MHFTYQCENSPPVATVTRYPSRHGAPPACLRPSSILFHPASSSVRKNKTTCLITHFITASGQARPSSQRIQQHPSFPALFYPPKHNLKPDGKGNKLAPLLAQHTGSSERCCVACGEIQSGVSFFHCVTECRTVGLTAGCTCCIGGALRVSFCECVGKTVAAPPPCHQVRSTERLRGKVWSIFSPTLSCCFYGVAAAAAAAKTVTAITSGK